MITRVLWIFCGLMPISGVLLASDATGVGHGDVMDLFLEATRANVVETLKTIHPEEEPQTLCDCQPGTKPRTLCQFLQSLTPAQRQYCNQFLVATTAQMLQLNTQSPVTPFALTDQPIPTGASGRASAMTPLGPSGPITFQYDSIRSLAPMYLLALMGHEFGHKSEFEGGYVGDDEKIGPFDFDGGGRLLMDSVGAAIALRAAVQKIIGSSFNLQDIFACHITERPSGLTFNSKVRSDRLFRGDSYQFYDTGIGNSSRDDSCDLELNDHSHLFYRVRIHEERGCQSPASETERWTSAEVLRVSPPGNESPAVRLQSRMFPGWNPICDGKPGRPVALSLKGNGGQQYEFEVEYAGSVGQTGQSPAR